MHRGYQSKALLDSALMKTSFYLFSDVYKATAGGEVEPEFFAVGFHSLLLSNFLTSFMILHYSSMLRWQTSCPPHPRPNPDGDLIRREETADYSRLCMESCNRYSMDEWSDLFLKYKSFLPKVLTHVIEVLGDKSCPHLNSIPF